MPSATNRIQLYWGCPLAAQAYRADRLSPADQAKAARRRQPRSQREWQVSRALLQQVQPEGTHNLSHAAEHAVLACAPAGWRLGVDLEQIRPRDVQRLIHPCGLADEQAYLATLDGDAALRQFYRYWTLKEAFIKAHGLPFPSALKQIGLNRAGDAWRLQVPEDSAGSWSVRIVELSPDWLLSVVWQAPTAVPCQEPDWQAGPCSVLPERQVWLAIDPWAEAP
ncbi:MAG: 4'-phosphopantetheinyl transferase superfamily protein [Gammaproteobacteria bacterium]|nr:4'-phosphopantetheinyl transferase superfamily protein [Gammaproteobacteria bacterium]